MTKRRYRFCRNTILTVTCAYLTTYVMIAVGSSDERTGRTRRGARATQPAAGELPSVLPATRILFAHPSWLRWWWLGNFEEAKREGRPLPITHVWCVFVETDSGNDSIKYLPEVEARTRKLGLTFIHGVRHAHASLDDWGLPLTRAWNEQAVQELRMVRVDEYGLDMEPYYSGGKRYHTWDQGAELFAAAEPWRQLPAPRLYVYPAHPTMIGPIAVMQQAKRGGIDVVAMDHTTYRANRFDNLGGYMTLRHAFWEGQGIAYAPGFYLFYLQDEAVMEWAAKYERCWFFGRTRGPNGEVHPDDMPSFGKSSWKPTPPE